MSNICFVSILIGFGILSAYSKDSAMPVPDAVFVFDLIEGGAENDTIPPIITILSPLEDSLYFVNFSNPEVHVQVDDQDLKQSWLMFDGDGSWISFGKEINFELENISSGGQGNILVIAEDMSGNVARDSVVFTWTHLDVEGIAIPRNLRATNVERYSIDLQWDYYEGGFCIDPHYLIFIDDLVVDTSYSKSYTLTPCTPGTRYSIAVAARKSCWRGAYRQSSRSDTIQVTTLRANVGINTRVTYKFQIYPNPTDMDLNIENCWPDPCIIKLSSINGQLILSGEMEGSLLKLDLSPFPKGVYFITISSKEFLTTRKIIKL